jgi:predicted secreted hydrolase
MDHEFGTNALPDGTQGWDWFGLIFDDETELMVGQIRLEDGKLESQFGGLLIYPDGSTRYLKSGDFTISASDTWTSPHTEAVYPAGWDIQIMGEDEFSIRVDPLMDDQELYGTGITYWEGAVKISGDKSGYGYAELTGYVGSMQNRF